MPKQKVPSRNKVSELHEQVFSEERTALVKNDAAKLLQQKMKRTREQKAADQQRKKEKKKEASTSKN